MVSRSAILPPLSEGRRRYARTEALRPTTVLPPTTSATVVSELTKLVRCVMSTPSTLSRSSVLWYATPPPPDMQPTAESKMSSARSVSTSGRTTLTLSESSAEGGAELFARLSATSPEVRRVIGEDFDFAGAPPESRSREASGPALPEIATGPRAGKPRAIRADVRRLYAEQGDKCA